MFLHCTFWMFTTTLSGNVPPALKGLDDGFVYELNSGLCGIRFSSLKACDTSDHVNSTRPEPYGAGVDGLTRGTQETANVKLPCNGKCQNSSKSKQATSIRIGIILVTIAI